jgi:hypothetical protein
LRNDFSTRLAAPSSNVLPNGLRRDLALKRPLQVDRLMQP